MGLRKLEFLVLVFFFLLPSSSTWQYLFVSAFNENQRVRSGGISENHSTKARVIEEIIVDRRGAGGTGGSHGGTSYSSNSAMNHGNNNDNKPSNRKSDGCTINCIGLHFTHLGFLLLSFVFLI